MNVKKSISGAARSSALGLYNAAGLMRPDHTPLRSFDEIPVSDQEMPQMRRTAEDESEVTVFGKLLGLTGGAVALIGAGLELLPNSETAAQLTLSSGLGAAAIGGLVYAYDKLGR